MGLNNPVQPQIPRTFVWVIMGPVETGTEKGPTYRVRVEAAAERNARL